MAVHALTGKPITANGLGLMRLTAKPLDAAQDETYFKVLKKALELGANVWNGADFYGTPEANSLHILKRYFEKYPEDAKKVVLCIKSGIANMKTFDMDCSPEGMQRAVANANSILAGTKNIDIFGPARVDPNVPVEITVGALAELVKKGEINGIQLSEVSADTIRRAAKVAKIDMIEAEISLWSREVFSNGVAEACAENDIVLLAHTPLGAGMLTGTLKSRDDLPESDYHKHMFPRFAEENFSQNYKLVEALSVLAKKKGVSNAQLALGWIRTKSGSKGMPVILPIAGGRSEERVEENCSDVVLTDTEMEELEKVVGGFEVAGSRFPPGAARLNQY
ncbi:NADP-dependent oxidoreductase domain-containing protein [Tricladium varicosporioides]|nr:NADP-dependent oxidoreductase domain-containing protein [Hymenoscyphus varicosporioides]